MLSISRRADIYDHDQFDEDNRLAKVVYGKLCALFGFDPNPPINSGLPIVASGAEIEITPAWEGHSMLTVPITIVVSNDKIDDLLEGVQR